MTIVSFRTIIVHRYFTFSKKEEVLLCSVQIAESNWLTVHGSVTIAAHLRLCNSPLSKACNSLHNPFSSLFSPRFNSPLHNLPFVLPHR